MKIKDENFLAKHPHGSRFDTKIKLNVSVFCFQVLFLNIYKILIVIIS